MTIAVGTQTGTDADVTLGHRDRFTGTYIVGKMGMGKSTLIQSLVMDQIESGHGFLVMEPKGDLVEDILELIPEERAADVILLDYGDTDYPPGFDLFDLTGIETIHERAAYIREIVNGFEKTLGKDSWGANIENLFMAVANTFTQNPGVVLSDIKRILTDDAFRDRCMRRLTSPFTRDAREFWERYDRMKGKDTYINGTITRVQRFLFDPILQAVTVQAGRSLDVGRAIRERSIVLISLPERTLGAKGVELLGTLYLSRIRLATQRQFSIPERDRIPFFVYLDEFQRFASGDIESFVAEARGAKVGLTMAHQWRSQIDDPGVRQAPLAVGNTFVFQVTPEDAAVFARGMARVPMVTPPRDFPPSLGIFPLHELSEHDRDYYEWIMETPNSVRDQANELAQRIATEEAFLQREIWREPQKRLADYMNSITGQNSAANTHEVGKTIEKRHFDETGEVRRSTELGDAYTWIWTELNHYLIARENRTGVPDIAAYPKHYEETVGRALGVMWHEWWAGEPPIDPPPHILSPPGEYPVVEIEEAWTRIIDYTERLGAILARYPMYFEFSLKQRERRLADAEKPPPKEKIAAALTSLPRYHAHAKLSQGEQSVEMTLKTTRVQRAGGESVAPIVRERSRRIYCMTMEEATEMIEKRQGDTESEREEMEAVVFLDAPPRRGGV